MEFTTYYESGCGFRHMHVTVYHVEKIDHHIRKHFTRSFIYYYKHDNPYHQDNYTQQKNRALAARLRIGWQ